VIRHAEAAFVVCEDQEQVDKILEVSEELPLVEHIVVMDMRGLRRYDDPRIVSFEVVEAMGSEWRRSSPRCSTSWSRPPTRRPGLPHLHLRDHRLPKGR